MTVLTSWRYGENGVNNIPVHGNFSAVLAGSERLWMSADKTQRQNLEVGQWAPATIATSDDGSTYIDYGNNDRYVSPSEVDVNELGTVTLDPAQVSQAMASVKISWEDDALNTQLDNVRFFAFDGADPNLPPEELLVVAFERTDVAVKKNRIGGDTAGRAWDADYGVNAVVNSLECDPKPLAASHDFYIGFSVKVLSYGLHTNGMLRLSFDVS